MNSTALENWSKISKLAGGLSVSALGLVDGATGAYGAVGAVESIYLNSVVAMVANVEAAWEDKFL